MRYASLFSGIEAASVAFRQLGWYPVLFSEVDAFPSAVLAQRFPMVPNLGDITKIDWKEAKRAFGAVDLVVGGSPCQSFSIAGNRTGLEGESGLMWEYVRAVRGLMPRWILWENVPGALSSSNGEDFRCLLGALDELGYGLAWRVLDAQFFGVAQRRRRLFLVGCLGDGGAERACEVLFEPESLSWDTPSSREKRKELAARSGSGSEAAGFQWNSGGNTGLSIGESSPTVVSSAPPAVCAGFKYHQGAGAGSIGYEVEQSPTITADYHNPAVIDVKCGPCDADGALNPFEHQSRRVYGTGGEAPTVTAQDGRGPQPPIVLCMTGQQPNSMVSSEVCGTLTAHEARGGVDRMRDAIGFAQNTRDEVRLQGGDGEVAGALSASQGMKQTTYVAQNFTVRRLTPMECERLQGFPDDWTKIPYRGKPADECPDTPRYKAIGNSMAVPVMRWIAERIQEVDECQSR